jgi:hypothetical protein
MKKNIFLLLSLILLTACAGLKATENSMAEDPGSPKKIALLRERVNDFWSASVKGDYEKVYSLYDPFFRAKHSDKSSVIGTLIGKIKYHKFEVKDINVEGNVAKVKVSIVYSVPGVKMKIQVFKVPETSAEFEEGWFYIYDNWYKEYYSTMVEKSSIDY